jgi:hypothetical protein
MQANSRPFAINGLLGITTCSKESNRLRKVQQIATLLNFGAVNFIFTTEFWILGSFKDTELTENFSGCG